MYLPPNGLPSLSFLLHHLKAIDVSEWTSRELLSSVSKIKACLSFGLKSQKILEQGYKARQSTGFLLHS